MAGFSGWGQLASAILSLFGGAGSMASTFGEAGSGIAEAGSTIAKYAKPLGDMAGAAGGIAEGVSSIGGPKPTPMIGGQQGGGGVAGNPNAQIGLTADTARTGLASVKAQGQAAGLAGLSEDGYIEQLAAQLGVDPAQIRQMLGGGGTV